MSARALKTGETSTVGSVAASSAVASGRVSRAAFDGAATAVFAFLPAVFALFFAGATSGAMASDLMGFGSATLTAVFEVRRLLFLADRLRDGISTGVSSFFGV